MSSLANAKHHIETCGELKYLRQFDVISDSNGYTVDLSEIQFEGRVGVSNQIKIFNNGVRPTYVLFDNGEGHSSIDVNDNNTYNLKVSPDQGYNSISLAGEATTISIRCEDDDVTQITILVI